MRTVQGYYGSGNTPCDVIVDDDYRGGHWYAVEGSCNVNHTWMDVELGVNVEELEDDDCFTWPDGIHSEDDMEIARND